MSVKSGIQPTPELAARLQEMHAESSPVQVLRVQIVDDKLTETGVVEGPPTNKDLTVLAPLADGSAASYFLLRSTATKWILVQWVPNTLVKVKERMIYASTSAILKDAFGQEYVADVTNVTSRDELGGGSASPALSSLSGSLSTGSASASSSSSSLPNRLKNESLLSAREKSEREALLAEAQAQKEFKQEGKTGIGGYKASAVSAGDGVLDAVSRFQVGDVNFVQLSMSDDQKTVVLVKDVMAREGDLASHIAEKEPRFYLYSFGGAARKNIFIYCCPEKSPTKLRMVYSTAKPSILNLVSSTGIEFTKKLELTDITEMSHTALAAAAQESKWAGSGNSYSNNNSPAKAVSSAPTSHPVFGHVGADSKNLGKDGVRSAYQAGALTTAGGKKIVLPPAVAYQ